MIYLLIFSWVFILYISFKAYELETGKEELKKTIERMKVGQKNQEDREKQLLERIKFLEANQK